MTALRARGLGKRFGGRTVLSGVDLDVAPGRTVAILGRSGSGKTTLLRILCGFERADAGEVAIGGRVLAGPGRHERPERRRIGYVPQEGALFPHLTVGANVAFGLGRADRRRERGVADLLALVDLPAATARRLPHELSGGEQQRAALARALAIRPGLVLLDEPFSSLDAALRADTRAAVAAALRETGAAAVLVTHDQGEALSMGTTVAVLRDGRMVQVADPGTLYRRPVDLPLARFVGEAVVLPAHAVGGRAHTALGALPLAPGAPEGPCLAMLRPEQIALLPADAAPPPTALVLAVTFFGPDARVDLAPDGAGAGTITARVPGHLAPVPGVRVGVLVTGDAVAFPSDPVPTEQP